MKYFFVSSRRGSPPDSFESCDDKIKLNVRVAIAVDFDCKLLRLIALDSGLLIRGSEGDSLIHKRFLHIYLLYNYLSQSLYFPTETKHNINPNNGSLNMLLGTPDAFLICVFSPRYKLSLEVAGLLPLDIALVRSP